jgi:hypothetical protein
MEFILCLLFLLSEVGFTGLKDFQDWAFIVTASPLARVCNPCLTMALSLLTQLAREGQ